ARPEGHDNAYAQLTLVPPTRRVPQTPWARDLIVLLDTSGSMSGRPLTQLKAITTSLVDSLGPADQLEIVEFSNRVRRWQRSPVPMTPANRGKAKEFVAGLRASGGTDMHDGIRAALRPLRDEATRQVVLMTDGLIGFEGQILGHILRELPPGCRVHTVGVGNAPNRTLTQGAARAGAGHEAIVGLDEAVDEAVRDLLARTDQPLLVDVEVRGSALVERAPLRIADLLGGSPTRIALAVKPGGGTIEVVGRTPTGRFERTIEVAPCPAGTGRRVVATRYARERVADLEVLRTSDHAPADADATIERLGLDHGIATRLTSWVAVTQRATVDPRDPTRRQTVPQALPAGMSALGVGLRGAMDAMEVEELSLAVPVSLDDPLPSARPSTSDVRRRAYGVRRKRGRFGSARKERHRRMPDHVPAPGGVPPAKADLDEVDDGLEGRSASAIAQILLHDGERLILEVVFDQTIDWDARVVELLVGGVAHRVETDPAGTTMPHALSAGQTARIVLSWSGGRPDGFRMGPLEIELR
ncbi:MAG: VWA domain-containing protein, partial [Myxococcota bacterium]